MIIKQSAKDKIFIKNNLNKKQYKEFNKLENGSFLKKNIIKKPWGFEYLFYSHKIFSIWVLYLKKKGQTSMHAHLHKKTYLINTNLMNFSTLNKSIKLKPFNIVQINKGCFHRSKNIHKKYNVILEIEVPNYKYDIFRYNDLYNRARIGYESKIEKSKLARNFKKKIKRDKIFIYDKKKISDKFINGSEIIILIQGSVSLNNSFNLKLYNPIDLCEFNKIKFKANKKAKIIVIKK